MVHRLLFIQVPPAALTPFYCIFGLVVLATLFLVRPKWPKRRKAVEATFNSRGD